ncbi:MAG: hypothetical protein JW704_10495 [Anaerolineaceae bacterium]|nr:hypothetical protein [Anaerolineaceae bacterium]MBN2677598.1 hypothetical protein [Anaerolineaceae bacterium]
MKKILSIIVLASLMLMLLASCAPGTGIQINTPDSETAAGTPDPSEQIDVPGFSIKINAPGPNSLVNTAGPRGIVASTLIGIWHGIISPITLVMSFINPNVQMYDVHNDGSKYNLGFLVGVALVFLILGIIGGSRRH